MSLESYVQRDHTTSIGVVRTWSTPPAEATFRPVVFAIPGILSTLDDVVILGEGLGLLADMCILRLPSSTAAAVSPGTAADLSRMASELVETLFPDRPVVAFGVSSGAVIALGMKAANLARVVAIEPPLVTGALWPIEAQLREHLRRLDDPAASAFAIETLGVGPQTAQAHDRLEMLDSLTVPVDVLLGAEALQPQRASKRFPSLVDARARQALAAARGVRLHVLPNTGHNVLGQAFRGVREILLEACRRASAMPGSDRLAVDEPLLEATPLRARDLVYCGQGGNAFASAYLSLNPNARMTVADAPTSEGEALDAIVFGRPPAPDALAAAAARLKPGGHLIARWAGAPEELRTGLEPHGLTLRAPVDDSGTGVVRAQKLAPGVAPRPPVWVRMVAYSPLLMDIRTRLPARALRSEADLRVTYETAPFELTSPAGDQPKILVLQRPAETRMEVWRPFIAQAIREGWLLVMEYDDYPPLIAEIKGVAWSEDDFRRFGYLHAVQTTTPPLLKAFSPYNPDTVMFPNAAFDLLPFPEGERPARVFYGGVLRGRYPVEVARALGPAIEQHPQAEFVVIGDREVFDALPTAAKRYYEYMPFEAYLHLMSECSISLSPIEALPMRDTKSDAKFLDASRAGALTIASPTIYERTIEHGVNGLLAPQVEDWAPLLARALSDEPWRQGMARRAWEEVSDTRMFADQVAAREDWYRDLWSRRAELNEALMDRVPGLREAVNA